MIRSEWLAVEHHRIHVMELWPDGPRKEAGIAAARSTIESLASELPGGPAFCCATCAARAADRSRAPLFDRAA